MARAFVAVELPDSVRAAIEARVTPLRATLARSVRDVPSAQWHLTLRFLGDDADLGAVRDALADLALVEGRVRMGGFGAFPSARRARVIWCGVAGGASWLAQAEAAVGALVTPLGHERRSEPFLPHVTLARCRVPTDVRSGIAAAGTAPDADPVGGWFSVGEIVLFESVLGDDGARHRVHARFGLPPRVDP